MFPDDVLLALSQEEAMVENETSKVNEAMGVDDARLVRGINAVKQDGAKLSKRFAGIVQREAGRLMDQFNVLAEKLSQEEVEEILWAELKEPLDTVAEAIRLRAEQRQTKVSEQDADE